MPEDNELRSQKVPDVSGESLGCPLDPTHLDPTHPPPNHQNIRFQGLPVIHPYFPFRVQDLVVYHQPLDRHPTARQKSTDAFF